VRLNKLQLTLHLHHNLRAVWEEWRIFASHSVRHSTLAASRSRRLQLLDRIAPGRALVDGRENILPHYGLLGLLLKASCKWTLNHDDDDDGTNIDDGWTPVINTEVEYERSTLAQIIAAALRRLVQLPYIAYNTAQHQTASSTIHRSAQLTFSPSQLAVGGRSAVRPPSARPPI